MDATAATLPRRHRLANLIAWLLVTFLVLFPKGGIKLGAVPLTWGYLVIAVTALPLLAIRLLSMPLRLRPMQIAALVSLVPFQMLYSYAYLVRGVRELQYAIATVVSFFLLPPMFLAVYPAFLRWIDPERFRRHLCASILYAALFGIFLFFLHPFTGHFIEIPYLTVNAADYGTLELTKHIARGRFLKLISTYNNGNLYGVAMLMLMPLFFRLEPRLWKRNLLRGALILTLSRTVWAGLVLEQLLSVASQFGDLVGSLPVIYPRRAARHIIALVGTGTIIFVGLLFNSSNLAFLLDPTLGGRASDLQSAGSATFLPSSGVTGFAEVLYASAANLLGISGLLAILLIVLFPLALAAGSRVIRETPSRRAAAKGLILYALLAASDGATNLIPVMAFYWFLYMTMLSGLPGEQAAVHAAPLSEPAPDSAPLLLPASGGMARAWRSTRLAMLPLIARDPKQNEAERNS